MADLNANGWRMAANGRACGAKSSKLTTSTQPTQIQKLQCHLDHILKNDSKITDDPNDTLHYYEIVNDQIVEKTSNSGGSSGGRRRNRKRKTSKRRRSNKKAKSSKRR